MLSNFNNTVGAYRSYWLSLRRRAGPNVSSARGDAVGINPWRYNSSNPTNNPGAYDLWVQLSISGKTNLICNWNKQVQYNSPLP